MGEQLSRNSTCKLWKWNEFHLERCGLLSCSTGPKPASSQTFCRQLPSCGHTEWGFTPTYPLSCKDF
jgi:hypothetical protein